jgi:hypothetical protein
MLRHVRRRFSILTLAESQLQPQSRLSRGPVLGAAAQGIQPDVLDFRRHMTPITYLMIPLPSGDERGLRYWQKRC